MNTKLGNIACICIIIFFAHELVKRNLKYEKAQKYDNIIFEEGQGRRIIK